MAYRYVSFSEGNVPLLSDSRWRLLAKIANATAGGGGGGGGDVGACGENYGFIGTAPNQIFKLKNPDTGLANRIDAAGVDGVQTIDVQESSASC